MGYLSTTANNVRICKGDLYNLMILRDCVTTTDDISHFDVSRHKWDLVLVKMNVDRIKCERHR